MFKALKISCRKRAVAKLPSVPTGIIPLQGLGSAVVFFDPLEQGSGEAAEALCGFLKKNSVEAQPFILNRKKLNFYGKIKKKAPQVPQTDLFVSLVTGENFTEEYEARRSGARFKVGCRPLDGGVYDLVVAMPVWRGADPKESAGKIEEILSKIK